MQYTNASVNTARFPRCVSYTKRRKENAFDQNESIKKFKITMAMEALIAPWQRNETGSVSSLKEKKIILQLALEMLFMP